MIREEELIYRFGSIAAKITELDEHVKAVEEIWSDKINQKSIEDFYSTPEGQSYKADRLQKRALVRRNMTELTKQYRNDIRALIRSICGEMWDIGVLHYWTLIVGIVDKENGENPLFKRGMSATIFFGLDEEQSPTFDITCNSFRLTLDNWEYSNFIYGISQLGKQENMSKLSCICNEYSAKYTSYLNEDGTLSEELKHPVAAIQSVNNYI